MKVLDFIDLSQSKVDVEEPKLMRSMRILKRRIRTMMKGEANNQGQPMFKKRAPNQDGTSASQDKLRIGCGSQIIKPTCDTCRKRHYVECLLGTCNCFDFGKK